jgi:transcriptional repressor NrdR
MKCPYCGFLDDHVLESRTVRDGEVIKRRRECEFCSRRYTTYEHIEAQVMVVKHDGRRENLDRQKIIKGMLIACRKRPVAIERLEEVADSIERRIIDSGKREIPSEQIGEMVAEELRQLDQVAYVRFASVYRHFEDVGQFKDIIEVLHGDE